MDYKNLAIELAVLAALGLIYYFWQKRRIIQFEQNKSYAVAAPLLQACLIEKDQQSFEMLESFIIELDDFLHGKSASFPTVLAEQLAGHKACPHDLSEVIKESLKELKA